MASKKATSSTKLPTKSHYVRVNGPTGLRLYITNAALRDVPLALLQARVVTSIQKTGGSGLSSYSVGRKKLTVQVNFDRGEAHVQLARER